ncbi:MAG TPA: thiol reductant ABC exporter subunit CydC [Burkholderiales bacterium]|nr:thiol reductant ABC exporter subunit CydC [Burkholderiales bacterium]
MRGDLKLLGRLLGLLRPYWGWMALGAGLALVTALANVALMAVAGWFIAAMALAGAAGALINYFTPAALIRLLAIVRTGGRYLERLATHEATFRLLAELRVWLYRRLEPLAPARLERHRGADLLERIQADVETLQHAYLRLFVPVAAALTGVAIVTLVLACYSAAIALVGLALLLAAGVALPLFLRRAGEGPGAELVHTRAALRSALLDGVQGMADLQVYGAAKRQAREIERLTLRLGTAQRRLGTLSGIAEGAVGLCASLAMWGGVLLGVTLLGRGQLEPAQLPLLAFLVLASFEVVGPLPLAFERLGETLAAARRIFELVDAEPQVAEPRSPSPQARDGGISMRGVRLRYDAGAPWALDGLDLELKAGARLALLGPSGAGKSSVVQLLLRFREYQEGEVRLGGNDLRSYRAEDLRAMIAVVSQDTYLFNATILENLRIAAPQADEAAIERAARAAQIHDFIASLPEGYRSHVGEAGVRLSAGQARRVAIARALLRDAPILLLDEPTENLDAPTERALLADIDRLMAGRTVLLITHKLGGVLERVDEVLLLEGGRVVERGSRAELLRDGTRLARYRDDLAEPSAAG